MLFVNRKVARRDSSEERRLSQGEAEHRAGGLVAELDDVGADADDAEAGCGALAFFHEIDLTGEHQDGRADDRATLTRPRSAMADSVIAGRGTGGGASTIAGAASGFTGGGGAGCGRVPNTKGLRVVCETAARRASSSATRVGVVEIVAGGTLVTYGRDASAAWRGVVQHRWRRNDRREDSSAYEHRRCPGEQHAFF